MRAPWLTGILAQSDDEWWRNHISGWGGGWMWVWGALRMLARVALIGDHGVLPELCERLAPEPR